MKESQIKELRKKYNCPEKITEYTTAVWWYKKLEKEVIKKDTQIKQLQDKLGNVFDRIEKTINNLNLLYSGGIFIKELKTEINQIKTEMEG